MSRRHVHLIGIGGIGLSAIAQVLLARGDDVSGSDTRASSITQELESRGATVQIGHHAENVHGADLVLVTSAAPEDNPEIVEAHRLGIPVVKRQDFFPELMAGEKTIAVAGTNGKTTTTGMIATILIHGGLDPDVVVGGMFPELGGNARAGAGEYFVVEADEYDRAFLGLDPSVAVVTSIEMDHPDIFRDVDQVAQAFGEFVRRVPEDGAIVACGDSPRIIETVGEHGDAALVRYGLGPGNNWWATSIQQNSSGGSDWVAWHNGQRVGQFQIRVPGKHNVLNALAALAVADYVGVSSDVARTALADFRGAARRFEIKGEFGGVLIVDDYAHNPSKIRATLAAARGRFPDRTLWAVFQPHTYSRTLALLDDLAQSFADADHVIVTEVFAARERDSLGVSGRHIVEHMQHQDARFLSTMDECVQYLAKPLQPGDVLITMGAGDINQVGVQVATSRQGASHV